MIQHIATGLSVLFRSVDAELLSRFSSNLIIDQCKSFTPDAIGLRESTIKICSQAIDLVY